MILLPQQRPAAVPARGKEKCEPYYAYRAFALAGDFVDEQSRESEASV
jgi:hypothetical protein